MTGYTKLFGMIITSTIWGEDNATRIVWVTMLALKNQDHIVEGSVPGLATMARVSTEECRASLLKLSSPDPDSRTQDHEGRRIRAIDGGWLIINGEKYREKMNADERREYFRIKQQESRDRKRVKESQELSKTVKDSQGMSTQSTQSEAESESESESKSEEQTQEPESALPKQRLSEGLEAFRLRVGSWFKRRPETRWNDRELKVLKSVFALNTPESDIEGLEKRYNSGCEYLRSTPSTLLHNWQGEIDKVNNPSKPGKNGIGSPRQLSDSDRMAEKAGYKI